MNVAFDNDYFSLHGWVGALGASFGAKTRNSKAIECTKCKQQEKYLRHS